MRQQAQQVQQAQQAQQVSESIEIAVAPRVVYDAVTNVADMGRWSPECTGADVKAGSAPETTVGMRFTGHNSAGKSRSWSTNCTVTAADAAKRFTFQVRAVGLSIATWSYEFQPLESGASTKVTETWIDQRGRLMRAISPYVSGVHDRVTHNRQTMQVTLRRLKETLEKEHQSA